MGSKRGVLTAWTSPADPSLAATLEGHPLLLYHICHLCADVLDPPVHLQQHQPPSVRQGGPCEGETRLHSGPSRTQETNRFIGDGQTKLQVEAGRCPRSGPTYSCGCRVTGHCAGAVTPPWSGRCHRQQRRRPLLQLPSQRSMWKQSLRQRPRLLLHCWVSERPLAAGERGQETWLGELEPTQNPKIYWEPLWCWWLSNGMLPVGNREIQLVPW